MKIKNYVLTGLCILAMLSCQKEDIEDDAIAEDLEISKPLNVHKASGNNLSCVTKTYDYTGTDLTSFLDLSTGQAAMWPGNMITEKSLEKGTPTSIAIPGKFRNDIEVGIPALTGTNTDLFVNVQNPDIGTVDNSINKILSSFFKEGGSLAGKTIFNVVELKSKETVSLALNAGYSGPSVSLSGSLNLDFTNGKNKLAVTVKQEFYEVTVSPLSGLVGKFGWYNPDMLDEKDFNTFVSDYTNSPNTNPALFVNNISYGRFLTLVYESDESIKDVTAALEFKYKGVGDASADAKAKYNKTLNNTSVSVHQIGGNPSDSFTASIQALKGDISKILKILSKSAIVSKTNPGFPIGYNVGRASNGTTYSHSYSRLKGTYQDCQPVLTNKIRIEPYSVTTYDMNEDHGTSGLELYGNIQVDIFNQDTQQWEYANDMYWGYNSGHGDIRIDHYPFTKVQSTTPIGEGRSMDFEIQAVAGAKFRITGKTFECSGDICVRTRYGDHNTTKVFEYTPGNTRKWYFTDQYVGNSIGDKNSVSFSSSQIGDEGFKGDGSARSNVWLYQLSN